MSNQQLQKKTVTVDFRINYVFYAIIGRFLLLRKLLLDFPILFKLIYIKKSYVLTSRKKDNIIFSLLFR